MLSTLLRGCLAVRCIWWRSCIKPGRRHGTERSPSILHSQTTICSPKHQPPQQPLPKNIHCTASAAGDALYTTLPKSTLWLITVVHSDILYSLLSTISLVLSSSSVCETSSFYARQYTLRYVLVLFYKQNEWIFTLVQSLHKGNDWKYWNKSKNYVWYCRFYSGVWESVKSSGKTLVCVPFCSLWLRLVTVKLLSSFCWWGAAAVSRGRASWSHP